MINRKIKKYKNGAILVYKKCRKKHTAVTAGFVFGKNRDNYPEGTAHFCEHMFFKQTTSLNEKDLKKSMLDTFSRHNGATNLFFTEIDFCRSNKAIKPCFQLASDMLLNTKFSTRCVNTEKGVIKQELVRKLANQEARAYFTMQRAFRDKYTSNTTILGSEEEIDSITPKTLKKFRDDCFVSQNFLITIEGGLSYFRSKKYAEKYFINTLKSNPTYPVDKNMINEVTKSGNLQIEYFSSNKTICDISIRLDKEFENEKTKAILKMLSNVCNGLSGKLLGKLRDKGLVYSAGMTLDIVPNSYFFGTKFYCSSENVNQCIIEIGKLFDELKNELLDYNILKIKKENAKLAKDEFSYSIYPNNLFRNYLFFGKDIFSKKLKKQATKLFEKITPEDIRDFCKLALSKPENIYISIVSNAKPEAFYTYQEMQNILTHNKKPRKQKKVD